MIQVKEFINYQEGQEGEINKWLNEMGETIEFIDIKYSISTIKNSSEFGNDSSYSGALIIYKTKKRGVLRWLFQSTL